MDKTALNAHLVTTWLKHGFHHLKSAVDQMCGKIFGLVANEKNDQLDFAAC